MSSHEKETKLTHGVEVPDIGFVPSEHERYYCPNLSSVNLISWYHNVGCETDQHHIEHSLCYPYTEEGKQAAILHAKAMLGIAERATLDDENTRKLSSLIEDIRDGFFRVSDITYEREMVVNVFGGGPPFKTAGKNLVVTIELEDVSE